MYFRWSFFSTLRTAIPKSTGASHFLGIKHMQSRKEVDDRKSFRLPQQPVTPFRHLRWPFFASKRLVRFGLGQDWSGLNPTNKKSQKKFWISDQIFGFSDFVILTKILGYYFQKYVQQAAPKNWIRDLLVVGLSPGVGLELGLVRDWIWGWSVIITGKN